MGSFFRRAREREGPKRQARLDGNDGGAAARRLVQIDPQRADLSRLQVERHRLRLVTGLAQRNSALADVEQQGDDEACAAGDATLRLELSLRALNVGLQVDARGVRGKALELLRRERASLGQAFGAALEEHLERMSGASGAPHLLFEPGHLQEQGRVVGKGVGPLQTLQRRRRPTLVGEDLSPLRQLPGLTHLGVGRHVGGLGRPSLRALPSRQKGETTHQPHGEEPRNTSGARVDQHEITNGQRPYPFMGRRRLPRHPPTGPSRAH